MTAEERAELRALCERAGGPLDVHDYGSHWLINNDEWGVSVPASAGEANATLFAAARTALPRLLDALERQEARERVVAARAEQNYRRALAAERELAYLRKHGCYAAPSIEGGTAVIGRTPTAEEVRKAVANIAGRTTPPDQDPSTTDALRRAGVHLATQPLARPDRQRVQPVQEPSALDRIRAWLRGVPVRITKRGVSRLDFEAYRRGERR